MTDITQCCTCRVLLPNPSSVQVKKLCKQTTSVIFAIFVDSRGIFLEFLERRSSFYMAVSLRV